MGFEQYVYILLVNREGKQSSSLESDQIRIKVFSTQAGMDQWLMKHYKKLASSGVKHSGNIQWFNAKSYSGHDDVIIIRKERLYE